MTFTDKIFERANIRGVADYLLHGIGPTEDTRDYEARLNEAYLEFEEVALLYDDINSKLFDCANTTNSKVASIYMEIGIQTGILLMKDFHHNINQDEDVETADYQSMYNSLFKDVTSALKCLQDLEGEGVKKARETLKAAQRITEEIYMNSEKPLDE